MQLLNETSSHEEFVTWLHGFLSASQLETCMSQLEKGQGGQIDGDTLFLLTSKKELREDFGLDGTFATKIWARLSEYSLPLDVLKGICQP